MNNKKEQPEVNPAQININITAKQIFNANLGRGFKDAAKEKEEVTIVGFAIVNTTDIQSGEIKPISILASDQGVLYSGTSSVMESRLREFASLFSPDEIKSGVAVRFIEIKCGRGTATSLYLL